MADPAILGGVFYEPAIGSHSIVELIIASSQKIDTLWQIFITVNVALFGLFFINFDKLQGAKRHWKYLILSAYLGFVVMNGLALRGAYTHLVASYRQLRVIVQGREHEFDPMFWTGVVQMTLSNREEILYLTHGFALASVIAAMFLESRSE